jgi:hypothetical protein
MSCILNHFRITLFVSTILSLLCYHFHSITWKVKICFSNRLYSCISILNEWACITSEIYWLFRIEKIRFLGSTKYNILKHQDLSYYIVCFLNQNNLSNFLNLRIFFVRHFSHHHQHQLLFLHDFILPDGKSTIPAINDKAGNPIKT